MKSERTVWAQGLRIPLVIVEGLTEVGEEADRRLNATERRLDLATPDLSSWRAQLLAEGFDDLATRVTELAIEGFGLWAPEELS